MVRILTLVAVAVSLWAVAPPASAESAISVEDAFARASRPNAPVGAAFMTIVNSGETDDRLVAAASDVAERVELHTHIEDSDGIMRMRPVEEGFAIPAGGQHTLKRGGDHVMLMGLREPLETGGSVTVTLTFEGAGDIVVEIPVDLERTE